MGREPSAKRPVVEAAELDRETAGADGQTVVGASARVGGPTPASTWIAASGQPITDRLLEWPPDVFALTNLVLGRAEAFRYALAPGWSFDRVTDLGDGVEDVGGRWSAWARIKAARSPTW